MASLIGQKLGQYEIRSLLGQGGMATVYRAWQASMDREVAVKVINPGLTQGPEFLERFKREARTMGSLAHPFILKAFEYGQQGDLVYLVMELLPGGSLTNWMQQHPLSPDDAIRIINQVASALDYAHQRQIVHRDLKPQNVLLDHQPGAPRPGNAYLSDFGIARLLTQSTKLSQTGAGIGTPAYMAPEQWAGEGISNRTDIYAFGIMAYEMLAGEVPFQADTAYSMMHKHLTQKPPPIYELKPGLPRDLQPVLDKALAKDPSQRYASAGEMASALERSLIGSVSTTGAGKHARQSQSPAQEDTTILRPKSGRNPLMLGGVAVAAIALLTVLGIGLAGLGGLFTSTTPLSPSPTPIILLPTSTSTQRPVVILPTFTASPLPTATLTLTFTASPLPSPTPTLTAPPSSTSTPEPTLTPTDTDTPAPTATETSNPNTLVAQTRTAQGTLTANAIASYTKTPTPDIQQTTSAIIAEQDTQTAIAVSATADALTAEAISSFTLTFTLTPTITETPLPPTDTFTPTSTPTRRPTRTPVPTRVPTRTPTPTLAGNGNTFSVPPYNERKTPPSGSFELGNIQIEWYCSKQGYNTALTNAKRDFACTDPKTNAVKFRLTAKDFDSICQSRYQVRAFAIQNGTQNIQAYNWVCYRYYADTAPYTGWTPMQCTGFLQSRLIIGQTGRVTPGLPNKLRRQPSLTANVLGQIPGGDTFTVEDGAICTDDHIAWWKVTYNGVTGWTAEGQDITYWTEPG